jgi:hypothetical protein
MSLGNAVMARWKPVKNVMTATRSRRMNAPTVASWPAVGMASPESSKTHRPLATRNAMMEIAMRLIAAETVACSLAAVMASFVSISPMVS